MFFFCSIETSVKMTERILSEKDEREKVERNEKWETVRVLEL